MKVRIGYGLGTRASSDPDRFAALVTGLEAHRFDSLWLSERVTADWQAAETTGDGAPGGNNPTPDQDVVEEIGKALGVQYDDDEELRGGEEIADRDHDRWELDPASSEDFEDR